MLKLIGVIDAHDSELKLNGYNLWVSWYIRNPGGIINWRARNLVDNLIEVGISDNTHAICELYLLLVNKRWFSKVDKLDDFSSTVVVEQGMPVCEWTWDKPSPWVVNETLEFKVQLASNVLEIRLSDDADVTKIFETGRVQFGVDKDDFLSRIRLIDLEPSEVSTILTTFLHS